MAATTKRGRDAGSGRFIPIPVAKRRPDTSVVETIRVRKPASTPPKKGK